MLILLLYLCQYEQTDDKYAVVVACKLFRGSVMSFSIGNNIFRGPEVFGAFLFIAPAFKPGRLVKNEKNSHTYSE